MPFQEILEIIHFQEIQIDRSNIPERRNLLCWNHTWNYDCLIKFSLHHTNIIHDLQNNSYPCLITKSNLVYRILKQFHRRNFYRYCLELFVLRSNEHNKFIVFKKLGYRNR